MKKSCQIIICFLFFFFASSVFAGNVYANDYYGNNGANVAPYKSKKSQSKGGGYNNLKTKRKEIPSTGGFGTSVTPPSSYNSSHFSKPKSYNNNLYNSNPYNSKKSQSGGNFYNNLKTKRKETLSTGGFGTSVTPPSRYNSSPFSKPKSYDKNLYNNNPYNSNK